MSSSPYEPQHGQSASPGGPPPGAAPGSQPGSASGPEWTPAGEGAYRAEPTRPFAAADAGRSEPPPRPSQYDVGTPDPAPYQQDQQDPAWAQGGRSDTDYDSVRAREKDAFGGLKLGSALFGWLTAVGAMVILVGIVAAVAVGTDLREVIEGQTDGQDRIVGIIVLVVVLFVAYYCGGYVAGRMARFNGVRQGVGVWLWSVLIAAAVTALAAFTGETNRVIQELDLSTAALDFDNVTQESLIVLAIVLGVSLFGAIVGGLAGMRFHRRVDRAGFESDPYPAE